ncbi:MAG TPA: pyridoxamine 5'-phosphate oxidase family protein [Candidatus Dormibacteraeota bacterium]|nr:pyridoxamine 5'-phosphate oxidase family protein [Candidatus Dormibacteraeota bacterium]
MNTDDEPGGLESIPEEECLYLLGLHRLGRVAIDVDERPQVFPVTYAISGRMVAFRTAPGTKLANAPMSHVAFEVDDYDSATGVGWSVMVKGIAYETTDAVDRDSLEVRRQLVRPMAPGKRDRWVAIRPDEITGRRFRQHG